MENVTVRRVWPVAETVTTNELMMLLGLKTPSGVANLRARHPDFPAPVRATGNQNRFDLDAVVRWALQQRRTLDLEPAELEHMALKALASLSRKGSGRRAGKIADRSPAMPGTPEILPDVATTLHDSPALPGEVEYADATVDARARSLGIDPSAITSRALLPWVLAVAGPITGRVVDPACGWGSLLAAAADAGPAAEFIGADTDEQALTGAKARMAARRTTFTPLGIDSLAQGQMDELIGTADLVLADVPSGREQSTHAGRVPRMTNPEFGRPPVDEQGFVWLDLAIELMKPGGRAVVITHQRTLADSGRYDSFRAKMVESGLVAAVIALPKGVRSGQAASLAIWVLHRTEPGTRLPLIIDGPALQYGLREHNRESNQGGNITRAMATLASLIDERINRPTYGVAPGTRLPAGVSLASFDAPAELNPGRMSASDGYLATPPAPADRSGVLERIARARDALGDLAQLLSGNTTAGARLLPLAELVASGRVLYFDTTPMAGRLHLGGDPVALTPHGMSADLAAPPELETTTWHLEAGDVLLRQVDGGYAATLSKINGRSMPDPFTVLRSLDPDVTSRAIAMAINGLRESGWRWNSRGQFGFIDALDSIWIPIAADGSDDVAGDTTDWGRMRDLVHDLPDELRQLAVTLTDQTLLISDPRALGEPGRDAQAPPR